MRAIIGLPETPMEGLTMPTMTSSNVKVHSFLLCSALLTRGRAYALGTQTCVSHLAADGKRKQLP